ncbi:hypothetical protein CYLTODRAFT_454972 [Cylindrobasidium torrendii FP15055 ss-10]|uniref:Mid2 domain-containing protein n=1 Tax=Cylindrobasidium torrendii FP15055 ss-10 TaxID=1314674 RepID=A0A0D7B8K4_9AGAR|nr:hypothetical protein CYLTODRAFT_454972 [Cylindrobasidium torrendii FP15055 ss-10]
MFGFTRSFIVISSLSWILVNAAPVAERQFGSGLEVADLVARAADASAQPQTIETKNTVQTAQGPAEEVCTITLTPVTDASGNQVVEKVTTCTYTVNGTNGTNNGSNDGAAGSSDSSTTSSSAGPLSVGGFFTIPFSAASSSAPAATSSSAAATTVASSSAPPAESTTAATSSAQTEASSSVAASSSVVSSAATSAATSSTVKSTATSAAASQSTSTSQTSASAAAAEATTQSAAFELPGKTLSVLPIGLGVFAGISAIALIVVGLVTYERTKYRKAFRQRKLAEQGGTMGYGGMAER